MRAVAVGLLAVICLGGSVIAQTNLVSNKKTAVPIPKNPELMAAWEDCDRAADQRAAALRSPQGVNPTSILNPILLLSDLNRQQQMQEALPRRMADIERQRENCYQSAENLMRQREQAQYDQSRDEARGYRRISFETFVLNAKSMARENGKVSLKGVYIPTGDSGVLFAHRNDVAMMRTAGYSDYGLRIPLLTEDASREFRQYLLRCRTDPNTAQWGCPIIVAGRVTICKMSNPLKGQWEAPCISVDDGRAVDQ